MKNDWTCLRHSVRRMETGKAWHWLIPHLGPIRNEGISAQSPDRAKGGGQKKAQSLQPRLQCLYCPNQFLTHSISKSASPHHHTTTPPPHTHSLLCSLYVLPDAISNRPAFTLILSLHKCPPPPQYPTTENWRRLFPTSLCRAKQGWVLPKGLGVFSSPFTLC